MDLSLENMAVAEGWCVRMTVSIDRRETNELFLAGDALISWPTEGMRTSGSGPLERSSMFLSEIVSRPGGLELVFDNEESAERAAKILEYQVRKAFGG